MPSSVPHAIDAPHHPDALAPERIARVDVDGIGLCVYEWGPRDATPLLLAHGLWDTARGFDAFARHFAADFRVVAFDARGHGDSDWADAYPWSMDVRDIGALLAWIGTPAHVVGHSRGGGLAMDAAVAFPERVRSVVDIDGFGPPEGGFRLADEAPTPERHPADGCAEFLDHMRVLAERGFAWRPYPTLDALLARRAAQNPRIPAAWMRYFGFHCARATEDGWVWKVDPLTAAGHGPWHASWIAPLWKGLRAPVLALTGDTPDAWGPCDEATLQARLRFVPASQWRRAVVADAGHFVHMEHPAETARVVRAFLEEVS
ncbi:MAG: alpha/beta hydrolase [Myxococcota bacterium]